MSDMFRITIKRQDSASSASYLQTFACPATDRMTAANFLRELNASERIVDIEGNEAAPVAWECACLQKKCGACAMRINGNPALACSVFLHDVANRRGEILLEPLRRFPVIRDLKVDRSRVFELLKKMRVWLSGKDSYEFGQSKELQFHASECMLCGICLEVCPTFGSYPDFAGAAGMVKAGKIIDQNQDDAHRREVCKEYCSHFFKYCCQSLSCTKACPLHLPLEEIQAAANRQAVWKKA